MTGKIQVTGLVDRESEPQYRLQVVATDDGNPPLNATAIVNIVVLDVNDNVPRFVDPLLNIPIVVSTPLSSVIGTFLVLDEDAGDNGKVIYQLSGVDADQFSIDAGI